MSSWLKKRHILILLVILGVFTLYVIRVNLSVALVAMTTDKYEILENGTTIKHEAEFKWSNVIQGYLLSSFFYGYVVSHSFGGIFARYVGGRNSFAMTVICSSVASLISPWLAEWSPYALLVSRICVGVLEGLTFPGIYVLLANWMPENEKSRAVSQAHAGNYVGTVFSMMFFGYLAQVAGWRSLFWFSGSIGLIWAVIFLLMTSESPREHPSISKEELLYIESFTESPGSSNEDIPWKLLLTSRGMWILILPGFADNWGFYTIVTLLPKYFNDVYNFDLSKMGVISALPYILLASLMMVIGQVYDRIIARKWVSITVLRKLFVALGLVMEASFLLGAAYWENIAGNVFCFIMSVGSGAFSKSSTFAVPVDLSLRWSGIIYSIAATFGVMSGVISPSISGYILTDNPTINDWRKIFYVAIGIQLSGVILFTLFGTAESLKIDPPPNPKPGVTKLRTTELKDDLNQNDEVNNS